MKLNLNGELLENKVLFSADNRAFKYGDALFETLKVVNNQINFFEDHYFRLMASMRMLRMEIPMEFTLEHLESEILKTVTSNNLNSSCRVRLSIFRNDGGLYLPISNKINYLIEVKEINTTIKENYLLDLFNDYYVYSGILSTLKTTNRIHNVVASIFAKENNYDNCILVNEHKNIVEVINGNIFVVVGNTIKTPPIADGCIKGIIRKKLIEYLQTHETLEISEVSISPFELQKADEVFITNSIIGVQPVTKYRKKMFATKIGNLLREEILNLK